MQCLTSARFTMIADVLRPGGSDGSVDVSEDGEWEYQQDPITGEIVKVWVPVTTPGPTPDAQVLSVKCMVRGVVSSGIQQGTSERFGKLYENIDLAEMIFSPKTIITKRDRITNIRDAKTGQILWLEEESDKVNGQYKATVFNVEGVQPQFDPFGKLTSNMALLERASLS